MRRLIEVGPAVAYAGLIFFLSSQSSFPVPGRLWDFDKVLHCVEYSGLGFLTARALVGFSLRSAVPLGALIAALYGVSDEVHQLSVQGRSAEVLDAVADAVGSVAGAFAWHTWARSSLLRAR